MNEENVKKYVRLLKRQMKRNEKKYGQKTIITKKIDEYLLSEKLIICLHENTIPMGAKCEILHKQIVLARFVMMS